MSEFNTKGTKLSVAQVAENPQYKSLYGLYSVPEMGGSPEQIDVTNLEDSARRSINGLVSISSLDFEFYAQKDEEDTAQQVRDTWNILRSYQVADTVMQWKLEYPDGEGFEWTGRCAVRRQAVGVNDAVKFTLTIETGSPLTDI